MFPFNGISPYAVFLRAANQDKSDEPKKEPKKDWYSYVIPPFAACVAVMPAFPGLRDKSTLQKGETVKPVGIKKTAIGALKMAPTAGVTIGLQMIFQGRVEKEAQNVFEGHHLLSKFASSAVIGALSVFPLAALNGQSLEDGVWKSLKGITVKQGAAITVQETFFVFGVTASDPLAKLAKEKFGNAKWIDYAAAYGAGAFGSVVGHPANTILTRLQARLPIEKPSQYMFGVATKAHAVGKFAFFFKISKDILYSIY